MEELQQLKPFAFKRRYERVDWRKLASANLDQIARDLDFNALQENLTNIAFCNIELELDLRLVDPNFVKLFRMAQLTIEYLLYSQDYLSETIVSLEGRIKTQSKNEENMNEKLKLLEKALEKVKKEGHKRKKLLVDQQQLIEAGADNFHKEIKSSRDAEKENEIPNKLSAQLEDIKQRLILTESQLAEERKSYRDQSMKESELVVQRDVELMEKITEWQQETEQKHKEELVRVQTVLMTELREMHEKYNAAQNALEISHHGGSVSPLRPSALGNSIRDEDHDQERSQLMKEIQTLKDQLSNEQIKRYEAERKSLERSLSPVQKSSSSDRNKGSSDRAAELEEQIRVLNQLRDKDQKLLKKKDKQLLELSSRKSVSNTGKDHFPQADDYNKEMSNGEHQVNGDRKKKTLTFADETDSKLTSTPLASPSKDKPAVRTPEIREIPATDSSLTSAEDSLSSSAPPIHQDEEDEDETTLADATSTAQTLSTLGTLDLTGRSKQLREALAAEPGLMLEMKQKLQQVLNSELGRWDVPMDAEGLSSAKLSTKLQQISQERYRMAIKFKNLNYNEIRQQLEQTVNEAAENKLKPAKARASEPAKSVKIGGHGKTAAVRQSMGSTGSSLGVGGDSSSWGTTSSKWTDSGKREQLPADQLDSEAEDSDEDEEEEDEEEDTLNEYKPPVSAPTLIQSGPVPKSIPSTISNTSSAWGTTSDQGGLAPAPTAAIKVPGAQNDDWDDDDEDDDDASDLEERIILQKTDPLRQSTGSTGSKVSQNMANMIANIENKLMNRPEKAPAGGVNILDTSSKKPTGGIPSQAHQQLRIEDEDDFDISSDDDDKLDMNSTNNTYSSRKWGQGSGAVNTLSSKQGIATDKTPSIASEQASLTSVSGIAENKDDSDWSSKSDFNDL